ncbi:phosphatase PAP2 family protein [Streptomyces sp. NPDC050560]|uniref:phosphatase PAP2 family protein n=1 Tax=Streptomyces sp. NPDC050560 TaxID=3365630 RepID=UPI0037B62481
MPQTDAPGTGANAGSRLRWWTELPVILMVYAAYSIARVLARGDTDGAVGHGLSILRSEKFLHLNLEHPLNRLFTRHIWLGLPADFWYASLHYIVTPAIAVWLFRAHAAHYRAARTWLLTSTFVGLIGFTLVPTCPPRLLAASHGFVDTMAQYSGYGWWGGDASAPKGLGGMTNQYAAMPSLHVGWALWCGVMLWRHGRGPWTRVVAVGYPLTTTLVVMGTANHYLFDALAGVATMGVGLLLTRPVLRLVDNAKALLLRRPAAVPQGRANPAAPGRASSPAGGARPGARAARSGVVGAGCQTAAGERIPRQRKQRYEPTGRTAEAGDGAPAPAR